jgi:AAA domain
MNVPDDIEDLLGPAPQALKPAAAPRRAFQNWTDEDIDNQPELSFLVGDARRAILGESSLWQIYGKKKSAKTLFTMEAAFCIAFGLPFHGLPTKQGQVVYVVAEGGIKRNYKRFKALYLKHRVAMEAKGYMSLAEARRQTGNLILSDQAIALGSDDPKDPYGVKPFLAEMALQTVTNPVLIVLDTWARMLWASGGHDSAQEVVGPSLQACDVIRKKLGDCTVAMIAHVGAAGKEAKGLTDAINAVDGALECVKEGETFADAVFTFKTINIRHGEEGFKLRAKLRFPDGSPDDVNERSVTLDSDDAAVSSIAIAKATASTRKWLGALRSLNEPTVTVDAWINAAIGLKIIKGKTGGNAAEDSYRTAMTRARDELVKLGAIELPADKASVTLTLERVEQREAENDFGFGADDDDTGMVD